MNDWFEKIGLPVTDMGDRLGWGTQAFDCCRGLLKVSMTTTKTSDNKACGCISYEVEPVLLY